MSRDSSKPAGCFLDVVAAYNREDLPLPESCGQPAPTIEEMLAHPFRWGHLNERETEEMLMEFYIARRMRTN